MTEHELKCWPNEYDATARGDKPFEWRYDDRGYEVGDVLILRRWDPQTRYWTGPHYPSQRVVVTYILRGAFNVPANYVVMGIRPERSRYPDETGSFFREAPPSSGSSSRCVCSKNPPPAMGE